MLTLRKFLGDKGEKIAKKYLKKQGYKFLAKNFRAKTGEIDLIFSTKGGSVFTKKDKKQNEIIFVEVKTKSNENFGWPEEEFNADKRKKMWRTVQFWLWQNKIENDNWRIDLVAVDFSQNKSTPEIRHYQNVF